ncbi:Acetyl-CoA acetyltransferase [Pseudonocardia thermophila]|uniref:Acetyl-CoA acetyltransferase n=1 Tax=Pseudonocardia thermophila TaxID=1848 RepID=A0A1M6U5D8_PSETH|nr:lipid-transfer protein [Pseudonocardia thermophila]SHK64351.1 Acetyl-CoA acetyltransferase [Pseudonocardia thermophila]
MSTVHTAIVGLGYTEFMKRSNRSTLSLAEEACRKAIEDAGLSSEDVDGVISFAMNDSAPTQAVATALGLSAPGWMLDWLGGGNVSVAVVGAADAAIRAGLATTVVVYRAMNGRSGMRLGGTGQEMTADGSRQYMAPLGWMTYPQHVAMWCRRHMERYGTSKDALGRIATVTRSHAIRNPRAQQRKPMTLADYHGSPRIVDPFNLYDICLETDGACAVVVTSAERARSLRHRPVGVLSAAYGGRQSPGVDLDDDLAWPDMSENFTGAIRERLFGLAGIGPDDVDVAEIYDCFTYSVIMALEGLGFAKPGEGGDYAQDPSTLTMESSMPVNTHGGLLSEAYIHGLNHVVEATEQLRGQAGERQVPDAEIALVTGGAMTVGSGLILAAL